MTTTLRKGTRVSGQQRTDLGQDVVRRYTDGESVRRIADSLGRSYGFVHNLLVEHGVERRSRGGNTRGKRA